MHGLCNTLRLTYAVTTCCMPTEANVLVPALWPSQTLHVTKAVTCVVTMQADARALQDGDEPGMLLMDPTYPGCEPDKPIHQSIYCNPYSVSGIHLGSQQPDGSDD